LAASSILDKDGWAFVRAQAVAVLAKAPAAAPIDDALARALRDASVAVRGAAVVGLAHHRASAHKAGLRARLDDPDEDTDVRAAAAQALGAVCDSGSADRLTELARTLAAPATGEEQQAVAIGALVGLAAMQPKDLKSRLAPLLAPSVPTHVRAAAEQALAARSSCR
jgi:HEAT repeat protein